MRIPNNFNPWVAMKGHRNRKLLKKLIALKKKKKEVEK